MKGVTDLYFNHKIDELCDILEFAIKRPQSVSTKIDGKPALFMWSSFPGLRGPGVSFKRLLEQLKRPDRQLGTYFTSDQEIDDYMSRSERTEGFIKHRGDSFKCALKMAPFVAPGHILWGDVLFTPGEIKSVGGLFSCTPNTIEYQIDPKVFPQVKNANFGIFLHTDIDGKLGTQIIKNLSKLLTYKGEMVLQPSDLVPETDLSTSELMSELDRLRQDGQECKDLMEANDILRTTCRRLVNKIDLNLTQKIDNLPKKYKENGAKVITNAMGFINLKEYILNNTSIHGIKSLINGERSNGEGYVIDMPGHEPLKLVSDTDFTAFNKIHMAYSRMNERIVDDGQTVLAWSSSKDTQLFNYYLGKNLRYGDNGGSNYGFATYCVTEPPFTDAAQVGYSDEYRRKLYGDNIFEFKIPTDKIVFFDYQDYLKSKQGQKQQASFNNFVRVQLKSLGVRMTEEEYQSLQPTDEKKPTASVAIKLYQIMSRYFYQGHRGNLRTPIDGFQYRGRNDGNTLVVWNSNRLIPVRYSNDLGQTWQDCDNNSEVYKDYIKLAQNANYAYNEPKYKNSIFDGKKTPEKKEIYRLLMKYNSNDGVNDKGKSLGLSDGIFYNIKIKDDKKIDASFKFNLPYVDYGEHFFRLRKNQFLDQIFDKGYRFGKLDCGLKIGSEHNPNETWESVEDRWWPEEVTGGFKLVCLPINKRQFKYQTKFGQKKLYLTKCHIEEDVFDGWEVILDPEKPNFCKKEVKDQLTKKYDWANNLTEEEPLMESALKKYKLEEKKSDITPELRAFVSQLLSDNDLVLIEKYPRTGIVENVEDSFVSKKIGPNEINVKAADNKGMKRRQIVNNFISYAKANGIYKDDFFDKLVLVQKDDIILQLRFREEYSEEKTSGVDFADISENCIVAVMNNYNKFNFGASLEDFISTLEEIYPDSKNISYDKKEMETVMSVPQILVRGLNLDTSDIVVTRSEEGPFGTALCRMLRKSCKMQYKSWNVSDIWIYNKKNEAYIFDNLIYLTNLDPNNFESNIKEVNSFFRNELKENRLCGVTLKKLDFVDLSFSINKNFANASDNVNEEKDTFYDIDWSKENTYTMYVRSKWSTEHHNGYIYRSPNNSQYRTPGFNYKQTGGQSSWVYSGKFCSFEEISNVLNKSVYQKPFRELKDFEIKNIISDILKSDLKLSDRTISRITNIQNNPSLITKLDRCLYLVMSCFISMTYILSQMSQEERNNFCTRIMHYVKKEYNDGPYVYIFVDHNLLWNKKK